MTRSISAKLGATRTLSAVLGLAVGVFGLAPVAGAAAPPKIVTQSLYVLTCAGSSLTAAFREAKGIRKAASSGKKPGSIVLTAPASTALMTQLKEWSSRRTALECAISQESADGQMIASWTISHAVPEKLDVGNASAGGHSVQTVTLTIAFASLSKA